MNRNQLTLTLEAYLHFDGTTMAIEVTRLASGAEVFFGHNDVGARVIEFLRAKGLEVYDERREEPTGDPRSLPISVDYDPEPVPAPTKPIFGGDIETHHVTHNPTPEIKL